MVYLGTNLTKRIESPYPDGCRSAVSLSFDDGRRCQLDIALPILNDRELLSTFYVPPKDSAAGSDWATALSEWKEVVRQGHEVGNHTLSHICSRGFRNSLEERCLETMTLQEIETDILEAERRLNEVLGPAQRTFAYPCYQDYVGDGLTRQSYVPIIAKYFIAARCRGEQANYPLTCSMTYLWSYPVEGMSGSAMIELIERAKSLGQWCILTLHGIDTGGLMVYKKDFLEVCDFLARDRGDIWIAPVIDVARRIIDWRASLTPTIQEI